MIDKQFTLVLTGAQLNLIGNAIDQTKAALDVVALGIQKQANDQLAREQVAAAMASQQEASGQTNDAGSGE
jgi:hypothetical protein